MSRGYSFSFSTTGCTGTAAFGGTLFPGVYRVSAAGSGYSDVPTASQVLLDRVEVERAVEHRQLLEQFALVVVEQLGGDARLRGRRREPDSQLAHQTLAEPVARAAPARPSCAHSDAQGPPTSWT